MQIDKFGKFPYVLVKLSDRVAGNKLIVRGKNGRTEPQLVSGVSQEVRCISEAGPAGMSERLRRCMYGASCDSAYRGCTSCTSASLGKSGQGDACLRSTQMVSSWQASLD